MIDGDFDDVRRHAKLDHAGDGRQASEGTIVFVASFMVRFLDALDLLNDLAFQLLSAISRTSEHFQVSPPLRLSVRMFGSGG
jgi:hypothetical protein